MVQEDPEDFFGHVGDFARPQFVGAWDVHAQNEVDGSSVVWFGWFAEILKDTAGSLLEGFGG